MEREWVDRQPSQREKESATTAVLILIELQNTTNVSMFTELTFWNF